MSGTRAALAGGTTCLIDFIIPKKGQDLVKAYDEWASRARGEACCDYSFHCAITSWDPLKTPIEMERLVKERGINSFKVFLAYKGSLQVLDDECLQVLEIAKKLAQLQWPIVSTLISLIMVRRKCTRWEYWVLKVTTGVVPRRLKLKQHIE
jgi:dihydropyrimidinase